MALKYSVWMRLWCPRNFAKIHQKKITTIIIITVGNSRYTTKRSYKFYYFRSKMSCRVLVSNDIVCNTAPVQISTEKFSELKLCVSQNIHILGMFLSWSILNLLTHCKYSGIKYYWNDVRYSSTLLWFCHNGTLWNGILEIQFFFKKISPCPNCNYVRNWLRTISKLETHKNWHKSDLDNSRDDDIKLKKITICLNNWNVSIDL